MLQGRHAIRHPAVIEFTFVLFGENENVGYVTAVGRNDLHGDLCLAVLQLRSDNQGGEAIQHRGIQRTFHDPDKMGQGTGRLFVGWRSEPEGALDSGIRFWIIIVLEGGDLILDDLFRGQLGPWREIGKMTHSHPR